MKHAPGTVEDRLTRLERSAARWRAGALAAVAVLAIVMLGGAGGDKPAGPIDVLDVHTLRVLDDQGNRVASLAATPAGGGGIVLTNSKDKSSINLMANPGHPTILLGDAQGRNAVHLGADAIGGVIMSKHASGEYAFQVAPTEKGGVFMRTIGKDGKTIWQSPMYGETQQGK